jgi:tRNA threonylcarbamoyladenosine biosynthesis protein TsaB
MSRSPLLAIDTSTEIAGVAVLGDGVNVALSWDAGRNQTTAVLDQIDRCLALSGVGPADLGGIVVATGPGMFNGLRVGMSVAKGLAYGLDRPIAGVSTLLVAAEPWLEIGRNVVAVVAAGRGRVVWQSFSDGAGSDLDPVNTSLDELLDRLHDRRDLLVAGEVPHAESEILRERGAVVRTGHQGRRDPLAWAGVGCVRIARLGGDDLAALEPQYIHSRREAVAGA